MVSPGAGGRQVLLLVDLQNGLCKGSPDPTPLSTAVDEGNVLANAGVCLAAARKAGVEVIHVRLGFDPAYAARTNRTARFDDHEKNRRFLLGSASAEFCEEVTPADDELVVSKGSVSPFASTALHAVLTSRGLTQLYIAGVATHLAVESGVREAADRGFQTTVIADACAAPEPLHTHSIQSTLPAFAHVISTQDFVSLLADRA
ncbi:MAG: cysteine hydrolase [Frankiales bacterium]|jgi:nicotinamidase-related amidase|nr:cysteine hydrolase [Frankiales bacterium]